MPVLEMIDVSVVRDGQVLVGPIDWTVEADENWVVLGLNGCGKSTMLRVASFYLHPSSGTIRILGHELGKVDVRRMRPQVGYASAALADSFRNDISANDVVMTALHGALEPWWHEYDDADRARARGLLVEMGCARHADRSFNTLSSGERQRVLLARTLMTDPGIVLLDEPTAALDLAGRETLVADLDALAQGAGSPPVVLVTHHVEEIPAAFSHVLLLRDGAVLASGPIEETLSSGSLSETFGMQLSLERRNGRYLAMAARR